MGVRIDDLPVALGISRASFYGYRKGQRSISKEAWDKLEAAKARVRSDPHWEDPVQIEVARQEAAEVKTKELSELLVKALAMAQEGNTTLRARLAELEGELLRLRSKKNRDSA